MMMVEAGGTEKSWENYQTAPPRSTRRRWPRASRPPSRGSARSSQLQRELVDEGRRQAEPMDVPRRQLDYTPEQISPAVEAAAGPARPTRSSIADKAERNAAEADVRDGQLVAELLPRFAGRRRPRRRQAAQGRRPVAHQGGRPHAASSTRACASTGGAPTDLRPLSAEVGLVATAHGSGLFQRGETQVLNVTTLGMGRMDQMIDGIDPVDRKRYMHHYNFPPYSTGETGFMRGPKRREIGHGAPGRAGAAAGGAHDRGVPLHDPARLGGAVAPTARRRWRRCAARRCR